MTGRRRLQFGIGTLLAATAMCAAITAATVTYGGLSLLFLLLFVLVWTGAAFSIAWTTANARGASERLAFPLVAFNLVNWAAWYFNGWAFLCMTEGLRDRFYVAPVAEVLLDAARFHVFDAIAVVSTSATVFAAWRKNKTLLLAAASTAIWLWLIVFCLGFLTASVHLIRP